MRAGDRSSSVSVCTEHDSQCMIEGTGIPSGGGCRLRRLPWPPPVGLCPACMRHALAGVLAFLPSGAVRMIVSWPPAVVPLLRVHPGGRGFSDACRRCSADACAGVATTSPGAGVAGATGAGRAAATGSSKVVVAVAAAAAPHRAAGRTGRTCGSSIGGGTNGDGMRIGGRTRRGRGGGSCSQAGDAAAAAS